MRVLVPTAGRRNILLDAVRRCPQVTRLVTTEVDFTAPGVVSADVCYRVPRSADPAYIAALERIIRRERISHVLPLADLDLVGLAGCRERFAALGAALVAVPDATIDLCMDKWASHTMLEGLGVPVPHTVRLDELPPDGHGATYPACLKPRHAGMKNSPWYFFARLAGPQDLAAQRTRCAGREGDYLVQEHLEGRMEINVDFFARAGSLRRLVTLHRRGFGAGGGITRGTTIPCDPRIKTMTETIVSALHYDGPGNFQVWRDDAGGLAVTEINPRFSNSSALVCIPAGENYFELLFRMLGGEDVPPRFDAYELLTVTCAYAPVVVREDALVDPFA
ncbi:biotin carboxylase [Desulfobaculum xiamenense]|uniref:Biotin carboxylase n=1 Tax=Desulfobaculum xiamenense TaxID=995050 RepID=A0A846QM59_9BACT|nr:ATP-grasp domain-containing protein [Desulfobaculum xiamenense]NJB69191.1 biotin carboxylase [Desulfobaculum xiamenense]